MPQGDFWVMKKCRLLRSIASCGLTLAFLSLPLLSGCTAMASDKDLQTLEEARKQAESSEAELDTCKQRRAELERQLAQKKQELAKWQNIKSSVQQSLGQ
ncbi:MAG: septal ring factor EnvC (AmiA/AmiB activator) [Candidatus Latescibacterota bacterium]|jgi:septal ring factor EnvC (AmiA/AmiB activator)